MKVLFVVPYTVGKAASQRFRVEQWLPVLDDQNINYSIESFWSSAAWEVLYKQGYTYKKVTGLLKGMLKRVQLLFLLPGYSYIFIHREATPVGPPWFEWIAAKVFRKKIIFDFDDAIWLPNTTESNSPAAKFKWHNKTASIIKWSYKVSCGNHYLQQYALRFNPESIYLPTVLDTEQKYKLVKNQYTEKVKIGWIGSHSTISYLNLVEPILQQLELNYSFEFIVIADRKPDLELQALKFIKWQEKTEIADLLELNIGIMPLPDTDWAKGKGAFKALQYMALGIPAVVSAVGANATAVPNAIAGYSCNSLQEWYEKLELLLQHAELRAKLGQTGIRWVQERFSVKAHRQTFAQLFT